MTSIQTPMTELGSNIGRSMSVSSALSEMCRIDYSTINNQHHRKYSQQQAGLSGGAGNNSAGNILTIEELRTQLVSCFTCGVSWADQQVSLDCSECGGYALERPCPLCDGKCGSQPWRRDFTMSHACSKARWEGQCSLEVPKPAAAAAETASSGPETAESGDSRSASVTDSKTSAGASELPELCSKLEKLET